MCTNKEFFKTQNKTEISFDSNGQVPLPANIRPVIILKGSDYDLGYQWYQQLFQIFGSWILENIAKRQFNKSQLKALEIYKNYIRDYTPEWINMIKGMSEGATNAGVPLSYENILAHVVYPFSTESGNISPGCSGFAAWGKATTNGKLVAMGSTDHEPLPEVTIVVFPEEGGNNFITSPIYASMRSSGGHPGLNNQGLVNVHHAATRWIAAKPIEDRTPGVIEGLATWHTLRFANNANKALEMQLSYPSGDGNIGGFWADVKGNAFAIERNNPPIIRRAGDYGETDFLYSTNNAISKELDYAQNPPEKGNSYIEHGGWIGSGFTISSVTRNLWINNFLDSYKGQVDLDFAMMMMRFPGIPPDYPTLEEADAAYLPTKGKGWHVAPASLMNSLVGIVLPGEGLYYITNCAVRKGYSHAPGKHFYGIEPIHSFYQLKLTYNSDLADVIYGTRERARYNLYYANHELRKLSYWDIPYVPLDEVFNKAAIEWQKGRFYIEDAKKTAGNESIYNYGKALRAYTRCQALANHVYESLVPPPTTPMDLGLNKAKFLQDAGY